MSTNPAPQIPSSEKAMLGAILRGLGILQPTRARRLRLWLTDALGIVVSFVFAACFCALAILGVVALAKAVF